MIKTDSGGRGGGKGVNAKILAGLLILAALTILVGRGRENQIEPLASVVSADADDETGNKNYAATAPTPEDYVTIPAITKDELVANHSYDGGVNGNDFDNWFRSQGDLGSSRYSNLDQITKENVSGLKPIWNVKVDRHRFQVQGSAIFVNGLLISITSGNNLVALDPLTGKIRWKYAGGQKHRIAQRGLVFRPSSESGGGTLYMPNGDKLLAINPADGRLRKNFGNEGVVDLYNASRVAPVFIDDLVIIATLRPSVRAVDAYTGDTVWSTNLTPAESKSVFAAPWSGMSVDQERGLVFITMGNPKPALDGRNRPGDNAYSDSLVAINAIDGSVNWAFQEVRHDLWDLDLPSPPILTSIKPIGHENKIDVVVTTTKAGNTLLLDRASGKPIFDFRLRRAPSSNVEFEKASAFQPDLELPEPFARQQFDISDVTNISDAARDDVLERLKKKNYGFFIPPDPDRSTVFYGVVGGAGWPGGAVDAESGFLYVASNHIPFETLYAVEETPPFRQRAVSFLKARYRDMFRKQETSAVEYQKHCTSCHGTGKTEGIAPSLSRLGERFSRGYVGGIIRDGKDGMPAVTDITDDDIEKVLDFLFSQSNGTKRGVGQSSRNSVLSTRPFVDKDGYPASKPPWGTLNCIDLNSGRIVWSIPLGEYEELARDGIPITGTENIGGPLVTAGGLVFVAGTPDRMLRVFDDSTGEELWKYELPFPGSAPPITYEFEGKQYVFIAATGGGNMALSDPDDSVESGNAFVAFALP